MRTTVIAEAGECFNGDMETAHRMIFEAKKADCDIVKFQLLDMDEVSADDPEYEWFAKLDLSPPKLQRLIRWAAEEGIGILFTPVSVRTAQQLVDAGQDRVKIASSFIRKKELLAYIAQHFQTIYASTGMAGLDEIAEMLRVLKNVGDIRLLHCISEYPTGPLLEQRGLKAMEEKDARLNMMLMLKDVFKHCRIGYSDHTDGIFVPVVAAAMGARIIEKHMTLDRKTPLEAYRTGTAYMGTDHVLSAEPDELREMVRLIRHVDEVKGSWEWDRSEGEKILARFLRERYTQRDISS